jgi:transcription termination/antitermination protein NusG
MALRWYVLHVYSGFENRVKETILEQAKKKKLENRITEVMVPSEEVVELRRGVKVQTEKRFFPGYILVRMDMDDETWHFVRDIPKVSGFLGGKGKALPISDKEAELIVKQEQEGAEKARAKIIFEIGEEVRVSDGPFATFNGVVEDVDLDRERLKVSVSIFGRSTPVELEFSQVEKT